MVRDNNIDDKAIIDTHVHIFNIHQVVWEVIITFVENYLQEIADFFPSMIKSGEGVVRFPEENIFEVADRIIKFTGSLFSTSECILQTIENIYKRKKKEEKRKKKGVCVFIPLMMDVEYGIGFRDPDMEGEAVKGTAVIVDKIKNIKCLDEKIRIEMQRCMNQENRKMALEKMCEYVKCMKKLYRHHELQGISGKEKSAGNNDDHIVSELMKISDVIKDKGRTLKEKIALMMNSLQILEQITRKAFSIELIKDISGVFTRLLQSMDESEKASLLNHLTVYHHSMEKLESGRPVHNGKAAVYQGFSGLFSDTMSLIKEIRPEKTQVLHKNLPAEKISDYIDKSTQLIKEIGSPDNIPLNDATIDTVVKYEHLFGLLKQRVNDIKRLSRGKGAKLRKALENLCGELSGYIDIMADNDRSRIKGTGLDMDSLYFQCIAMKKVKEKEGAAVFPFVAIDPRRGYLLDPGTREKITPAEYVKHHVGQGKTFHGVKIYPTLWYLPSHPNLMEIYRICTEKKIPLTAHGAVDGFVFPPVTDKIHFYGYFSRKLYEYHGFKFDPAKSVTAKTEIDGEKVQFYFLDKKVNCRNPGSWSKYNSLNGGDIANLFSDPLNWIPVLENFKRPDEYADGEVSREECLSMHINIAHLGGLYEVARYIRKIAPDCKVDVHYQEGRVEPPVIWTHTMIALINAFPGVYTDFAFVDKSDLALNIHRIINHHGNEKLKERLMFGSDLWLMGFLKDPALFLEEYEYAIKRNCGNTVWKRITNTNPREFLFP